MTLRSCSPLLAATTVTKPQPHSRSGSCLLTSWMRLQALSWEFALKPAKSFKIISTTTSGQRVETWWQLWHLRIVFFLGAFGKSITRQQPGFFDYGYLFFCFGLVQATVKHCCDWRGTSSMKARRVWMLLGRRCWPILGLKWTFRNWSLVLCWWDVHNMVHF